MIPEFILPDFIEGNDPDTIQERMMKELPEDIDNMPGGFPWDFTRPTANEKSELIQSNLVKTLMLMFPMWAWNEWLDYHAASAGIKRREAGYANGKLKIYGIEGTQIPAGSVFATPAAETEPSVEFKTEYPCEIGSAGTAEVEITAVEAGEKGNVAANTITLMLKPIKGIIRINNLTMVTGGTAEESDTILRERIQDANESDSTSFIGNDSDYVRWAKEVTGVGSVVVLPEWNGPGTVKMVVMDANGQPANDTIISRVSDHILSPEDRMGRKAPIGAVLTVTAPSAVLVTYTCNAVLSNGYTAVTAAEEFKKNLQKYYDTAKKEGVLKYSRISSILSDTNGISDFTTLLVNGKEKNIIILQDEYPQTVSITLNQGG